MTSEPTYDPRFSDSAIVAEARKRFQRAMDWEGIARSRWLDDVRFANGDPYNGYQWHNNIRRNRDLDERPTLTINHVQLYNKMILNDAKQNKAGIVVRATGDQASFQSAEMLMGIIRHIEYNSNAQSAYDTGMRFQVEGGIGYWRVLTDYAHDESFDHEIYISRLRNPLNVLLDPDINEFDGSDARWGMIFDQMPRDEAEAKYPEFIEYMGQSALGNDQWTDRDHIMVCEYYRKIEQEDTLFAIQQGQSYQNVKASRLPDNVRDNLMNDPSVRKRTIKVPVVEWYFIIGDQVAETAIWPGRYIPIVRCVGDETVIDGILDRKGHTRMMLDPQRMYNYWSSSAVEHVALQGKTPWVGPAEAFEGFEEYWKTANKVNHAFMPYNHRSDDSENDIPPPQRAQPPQAAMAYIQGMQIAQQELMFVTGQHEAMVGMPGNERSGKAINERQRRGDNATYGFIDNLGIALRFTGKIILDLIPKVYDTQRIIKIQNEDGSDDNVQVNPVARQAYQEIALPTGAIVARILNPSIGRYDVHADMGPAYATRRQQAFDALVQIITQAPALVNIIGDLLLSSADFPKADEAARRMKNLVPPQALGKGPSPQEAQLMQTVQQLQGLLQSAIQDSAKKDLKLQAKETLREIDVYEAETKRLQAIAKIMPAADPQGLVQIIKELVHDMLQTSILGVMRDIQPLGAAGGAPPLEGARMGRDGNWYVGDPSRPGKYLRVNRRAAMIGAGPSPEDLQAALNGNAAGGQEDQNGPTP